MVETQDSGKYIHRPSEEQKGMGGGGGGGGGEGGGGRGLSPSTYITGTQLQFKAVRHWINRHLS